MTTCPDYGGHPDANGCGRCDGMGWVPPRDDMPDEDHLDEALLEAARQLGQCPVVVGTETTRPRRCAYVAGHEGQHAPNLFEPTTRCGLMFAYNDGQETRGYPCDRPEGHDGHHWNEAIRGATHNHQVPREAESADTRIQAGEEQARAIWRSAQGKPCGPACNCPPGTHAQHPMTMSGNTIHNETPGVIEMTVDVDTTALKAAWEKLDRAGEVYCGHRTLQEGCGGCGPVIPVDGWRSGPNTYPEPNTPPPRSRWGEGGIWDPGSDHREHPDGWQTGDEECAAGCEVPVLAASPAVVAKWSPTDRASHYWHPGCWSSYQAAKREAQENGTCMAWPIERGLGDGKALEKAAMEQEDHR